MIRLKDTIPVLSRCYWLFLARINELAIFSAASHVDCCDFEAAGELMMKPCRLIFSTEDEAAALSSDFPKIGTLPFAYRSTGKQKKLGLIYKGRCMEGDYKPLLAYLSEQMERCGYFAKGYLLSVSIRTGKIGGAAEMLADFKITNTEDLCFKLSCMDEAGRREFKSRLCLFDLNIFNDLGRALHLLMHFGDVKNKYISKYLRR